MSLRMALFVSFVATCVVPLVVFMLWPHSQALRTKVEEANERHLVLAKSAAEALSTYHLSVSKTFHSLVDPMSELQDISFAHDLLASLGFNHLCLVDFETRNIIAFLSVDGKDTPARLAPEVLNEVERLLSETTRPMDRIFVADIGQPQFILAAETDAGVVFASVNSERIKQVAKGISFDTNGHAVVLDSFGRVIAHPSEDWEREGHDLSGVKPIAHTFGGSEAEVILFWSPALEEDMVAGVAHVSKSGWTVIVPQPLSELQAQVTDLRQSSALVFAIGIAFSVLMALITTDLITRPINLVVRTTQKLAKDGPYLAIPRPSVSFVELEQLRNSVNGMSERIRVALSEMQDLAEKDPLTGLLNRRGLFEQAERLTLPLGEVSNRAAFVIDIDNFKQVNDLFGHGQGDATLISFAEVLRKVFPSTAVVARSGGDEFIAVCVVDTTSDARSLAERLIVQLSTLPDSKSNLSRISQSVGVAVCSDIDCDLQVLLAEADTAMYEAKRTGSDLRVYDALMKNEIRRRTLLAANLKADIKSQTIDAMFQPIFEMQSGRIAAFETLVRWCSSAGERLSSGELFEIAERQNMESELDLVIRQQAYALARDLARQGLKIPISVNVMAADLARFDFADRIFAEIRSADLRMSAVQIEVTEAIFDDRAGQAKCTIAKLRKHGIAVHLDDFGKGFSSHGLLEAQEFDGLKVDLGLGTPPLDRNRQMAVVSSLVDLGKRLDLPITLERIETLADERIARSLQVDCVQGFRYAKPMEANNAVTLACRIGEARGHKTEMESA